ncbi:MAG: PEP-CTERM sorting domain-containing protein [Cyanobacteria bacterium P01_F01_bin.150]
MRNKALCALMGAIAISAGVAGTAQAAIVGYDISWTGSNGYTLEGMFGFDDSLLGTGAIDETSLSSFTIEGFQNGSSIGSFDLSDGLASSSPFNFNFDTISETFIIGGDSDSITGQSWNFFGNPFGFGSGSAGQAIRLNNSFVSFVGANDSTLIATRKDSDFSDVSAVPEPLTVIGTLAAIGIGGAMKRKHAASANS